MEWNNKNYNVAMSRLMMKLFIFVFIMSILYYYFAFHIADSQWYAEGILQFNSFTAHYFPGVESRSIRGEEVFGNGRYIQYIGGVSLIIIPIEVLFLLYALIFKHLWYEGYSNDNIGKNILALLFFMILLSFMFSSWYFANTFSRLQYNSIGATLIYFSSNFSLVGIIITIIDQIRFFLKNINPKLS